MNLRTLITLLLLIPLGMYAQQFTDAFVIGGLGSQSVYKVTHDRVGNKYVFLFTDKPLTIDSAGVPITISNNQKEFVLIKYNQHDKYNYHLKIKTSTSSIYYNNIDIKFTSQNELILAFPFYHLDTIDLYHANHSYYKRVLIQNTRPNFIQSQNQALFISKISQTGNFVWSTTITKANLSQYYPGTLKVSTLILNDSNIYIGFRNNKIDQNTDTIIVKNSTNLADTIYSKKGTLLITLNQNGILKKYIDPLSSLKKHQHDSDNVKVFSITAIDNSVYFLISAAISQKDTLESKRGYLTLDTGINYILFKLNNIDSVDWVKLLLTSEIKSGVVRPQLELCEDTKDKKLILALNFDPYGNQIQHLNQPSIFGTFLYKIDTSSNITWSLFMNNIRYLFGINKNNVTNQLVFFGESLYPNGYFESYLPYNLYGIKTNIVAFFDSLNTVSKVHAIYANNTTFSSAIFPTSISTNINGKVTIGGYFTDSISLPCKTIQATLDYNNYGQKLTDGFLLEYSPILAIDTAVCNKMVSPSGKYTWDSTAYYFDTIPNKLGCDSTLLFYVKVMQHKVSIDTTVKVSMQSPSGKYIWDSTATYTDTLTNVFGCDSILTFKVKVLQNNSYVDTSVCNTFKLTGSLKTFANSGNFIDTLSNVWGGDSIVYIKLRVLKTAARIDTSFCNNILSPSGKFWLNTTGIYTDTLNNVANCDSIITINFNKTKNIDTLYLSWCNALLSPSGKFLMQQTQWYTDTLKTSNGCDSLLHIYFTKTSITDTINIKSCDYTTSPSGKFLMQQTQWYTDTLKTSNGCDSILYINFTLLKSVSSVVLVACDSLVAPSGKFVFKSPGIYSDTLTNVAGCDSIITINLTFSNTQVSITKSNDISCQNQSAALTATGGNLYVWQPSTGLSNNSINNPIANPAQNTLYTVKVTDVHGCVFTDTITVFVNSLDSVGSMPNVITPNNDGLNDCIAAEAMAEFTNCSFTILTRWGNVIWQSNNPKSTWCGLSENEQEVAAGTYYYILSGTTHCNQKINTSGTITVIR